MTGYLQKQKLARSQYRPRREDPSGAQVLHSTESPPDQNGPDIGAENVAKWMTRPMVVAEAWS